MYTHFASFSSFCRTLSNLCMCASWLLFVVRCQSSHLPPLAPAIHTQFSRKSFMCSATLAIDDFDVTNSKTIYGFMWSTHGHCFFKTCFQQIINTSSIWIVCKFVIIWCFMANRMNLRWATRILDLKSIGISQEEWSNGNTWSEWHHNDLDNLNDLYG